MAERALLGQSASSNDSQLRTLELSQAYTTEMVLGIERSSKTEIQTNGLSSIDREGAVESHKEDQHVCGPESGSSQVEGRRPSSSENGILFETLEARGEALISQNHAAVTASPVMSNHSRGSYTRIEFTCPSFTATDDHDFMSIGADGVQPMLSNQMECGGPEKSESEYQENQEELRQNVEQDDNDRNISQRPLKFVGNHNIVLPKPSRNEAQPERDTTFTRGFLNPPDNVPSISNCPTSESLERTNLDTACDHLFDHIRILGNPKPNGNRSKPDALLSCASHLQQRNVSGVQEEMQDQQSQSRNAGAPVPSTPNFQTASSTSVPGLGRCRVTKRKRTYSPRTTTNYVTCRRRKKKCDEQSPSCKSKITLKRPFRATPQISF